ncbi:hypothetical protein ACFW04_005671 [Cataglyphis niger]
MVKFKKKKTKNKKKTRIYTTIVSSRIRALFWQIIDTVVIGGR